MATRIRLQRFGKKNQPFYSIVIADGRAPRDGRFIEKIGTYNPLTHPATINLNFERALYWVEVGASPSETVRSILKREGVMLMKHLRGGIAKGALTEIEAQRRFEAWKQERDSKINNLKREAVEQERKESKLRLESESKVREAIAQKVAAKYQAEAQAEAEAEATVEGEEVSAEVQTEEPTPEDSNPEVKEDSAE